MNLKLTADYHLRKSWKLIFLIIFSLCVLLNVLLDHHESRFYQNPYNFSESFMFSSFWWLFLPLLYVQLRVAHQVKILTHIAMLIVLPIFTHLMLYPAMVWCISETFYPTTFAFWQTFDYEITTYSITILMAYTVPLALDKSIRSKIATEESTPELKNKHRTLVVNDGGRRISIDTQKVLYIVANTPYVNIHLEDKRHLYNETLKSLAQQLDENLFVRVHKSAIVNHTCVQHFKSRLNGDYDLTMKDGSVLRLSRNYAAAFKARFGNGTQDSTL